MPTRLLGRAGICVALCAAAGTGCAGPGRGSAAARGAVAITSSAASPMPAAFVPTSTPTAAPAQWRAEIVMRALSLLGVSYRFGGSSPETGLDCSGLVRHVFQEATGVALPRRTEELSRTGEDVDPRQLKPGDLVFFNTLRRAFSHVGIYIGNNQFVHAPSSGGQVRVEALNGRYWLARFDGARRLDVAPDPAPHALQADARD